MEIEDVLKVRFGVLYSDSKNKRLGQFWYARYDILLLEGKSNVVLMRI